MRRFILIFMLFLIGFGNAIAQYFPLCTPEARTGWVWEPLLGDVNCAFDAVNCAIDNCFIISHRADYNPGTTMPICTFEDMKEFLEAGGSLAGRGYLNWNSHANQVSVAVMGFIKNGDGLLARQVYYDYYVEQGWGTYIRMDQSDNRWTINCYYNKINEYSDCTGMFLHIDACYAGQSDEEFNDCWTFVGPLGNISIGRSAQFYNQFYQHLRGGYGAEKRSVYHGATEPDNFLASHEYLIGGSVGGRMTFTPAMIDINIEYADPLPLTANAVFDCPVVHTDIPFELQGSLIVVDDWYWQGDRTLVCEIVGTEVPYENCGGDFRILGHYIVSQYCDSLGASCRGCGAAPNSYEVHVGNPDAGSVTILESFADDKVTFKSVLERNLAHYYLEGLTPEGRWVQVAERPAGSREHEIPMEGFPDIDTARLFEVEQSGRIVYHGDISRGMKPRASHAWNAPIEHLWSQVHGRKRRLYDTVENRFGCRLPDEIPAFGKSVGVIVPDSLYPAIAPLEAWFDGIHDIYWCSSDQFSSAEQMRDHIVDWNVDYVCIIGKWNDSEMFTGECPDDWLETQQQGISWGMGNDGHLDIVPILYEEDPPPWWLNTFYWKWYSALGDAVGLGNLEKPVGRLNVRNSYELLARVDKIMDYTLLNGDYDQTILGFSLVGDEDFMWPGDGAYARQMDDDFQSWWVPGTHWWRVLETDGAILERINTCYHHLAYGVPVFMVGGSATSSINFANTLYKNYITTDWLPETSPFWLFSNACGINGTGTEIPYWGAAMSEEWNNCFDKGTIGSIASIEGSRTGGQQLFWEVFMEYVREDRGRPVSDFVLWAQQELLARPDLTEHERHTIETFTLDGWPTLAINNVPHASAVDEMPVQLRPNRCFNYPNPFQGTTQLRFIISEDGMVNLCVHDVMGRRVCTVIEARLEVGVYDLNWSGRNNQGRRLPSGMYYLQLQTGGRTLERKMQLLR